MAGLKILFVPILLGFSIGAAFGPINVILTKTAITRGLKASITFGLGCYIGDLVLLIGWSLVFSLPQRMISEPSSTDVFRRSMLILGGFVLCGIALVSFKRTSSMIQQANHNLLNEKQYAGIFNWFSGLLLTVSNPLGIILWAGVVSATYQKNIIFGKYVLLLIGLGDLMWFISWLFLLAVIRSRINSLFRTIIGMFSDFIIFGFGLTLILRGI